MRITSVFVTVSVLAVGCGGAEPASQSSTDRTLPSTCPDTTSITLSQLKTDVFAACASSSCHAPGRRAGDLDLVTDPHRALVGIPPDATGSAKRGWTAPPDLRRVTPFDETKSLLYLKLTMLEATDPALGRRMPDTGQTLEPCDVQKVRDWIRRGAPND